MTYFTIYVPLKIFIYISDIDYTLGLPIRDYLGNDLGVYEMLDDMVAMDTSTLVHLFSNHNQNRRGIILKITATSQFWL